MRDVRYAVRQLIRAPAFSAIVILTLAVGVGATTAMFSVVNGVLVRELPYREPDRLIAIDGLGYKGEFVHLRDHAGTFEVGGYGVERPVTLTEAGDPARLTAVPVTDRLFRVLGVPAALGRTLLSADTQPDSPAVVVLSHPTWQQRFGGAADIIGRQLTLDGTRRTIVGVMPAAFRFPSPDAHVWTPLVIREADRIDLWAQGASMIARLRGASTLDDAGVELRQHVPTMRGMFPWKMPADYGIEVDVVPLRAHMVGDVRQALLVLFAAVLAVMAIVCVNVANLMLTRGIGRQKEMAIRAAIGAGRARLVRQSLVESLTLAAVAGGAGVLLASAGTGVLVAWLPAGMPRVDEISVDGRVLAFGGGVSLLTGLLVGLWPALRTAASQVDPMLREAGRMAGVTTRQRRAAGVLVVAEIALAAVLVTSAALLARSVRNLVSVDPGFQAERLVTASVAPPVFRYGDAPARREFVARLLERLRGLPGVSHASAASGMPLGATTYGAVFSVEGRPDPAGTGDWPLAHVMATTDADYFRSMGMPVVDGRPFTPDDRAGGERVAIVSRSLADAYWPGASPVGARIRLPGNSPWLRVIGVAADVKWNGLAEQGNRTIYVPIAQGDLSTVALVIRTAGDPAAVTRSLRDVVSSLDAETPVTDVRTGEALIGDAAARPRFTASLLGLFAFLALALGALGVYGVLAHGVSQRRQEFGVRLALGAQGSDLFRHVLGHGLAVGVTGVLIGLALSIAATRALASLLFGLSPGDPVVFGGVAVTLLATALAASVLPALSASRVDPMIALRDQP